MFLEGHVDAVKDILREAWGDYASNFRKVAILSIAIMAIPVVCDAAIAQSLDGKLLHVAKMLSSASSLLFSTLLLGALLRLFDFSEKKEPFTLLKCAYMGWRRYFKLLALNFLFFLLIAVPLIATLLLIAAAGPFGMLGLALSAIAIFAELALIFCLMVRLSLIFPICLFEGWDFGRLIARSYVQMSGNFLIFLAAYFAGFLFLLAVVIIISSACMLGHLAIYGVKVSASPWLAGLEDLGIGFSAEIAGAFVIAILYRSYRRLCEG